MWKQTNNQYEYYQVLLIETTSNATIVHPYQFLIDQVLEFEELEELSRKNFDMEYGWSYEFVVPEFIYLGKTKESYLADPPDIPQDIIGRIGPCEILLTRMLWILPSLPEDKGEISP